MVLFFLEGFKKHVFDLHWSSVKSFSCLEAVDWRSIERPALFLLPTRTIELSKRLPGLRLHLKTIQNYVKQFFINLMFGLRPLSSTWNLNIMFNFRGVSLLPDSPRLEEKTWGSKATSICWSKLLVSLVWVLSIWHVGELSWLYRTHWLGH